MDDFWNKYWPLRVLWKTKVSHEREDLRLPSTRPNRLPSISERIRVKKIAAEPAPQQAKPHQAKKVTWFYDEASRLILSPIPAPLLVARHEGLINRLRLMVSDEWLFESFLLPLIFDWAHLVQALPAQPQGVYSENDGLFRAGLESALLSLQLIETKIVGLGLSPIDRSHYEKATRLSLILLALLRETKSLSTCRILAGVEDRFHDRFLVTMPFSPIESTLFDFASRYSDKTLLLEWTEGQSHRLERLSILKHLLRDPLLDYLNGSSGFLKNIEALALEISPSDKVGFMLEEALTLGKSLAIEKEIRARGARYGRQPMLLPWAGIIDYLVRENLRKGLWRLNKTPIFWGTDGVFLVWPLAAPDLIEGAQKFKTRFELPEDLFALAAALCEGGFCAYSENGNPLHRILLPGSRDECDALLWVHQADILTASRFSNAEDLKKPTLSFLARGREERLEKSRYKTPKPRFSWGLSLPSGTPEALREAFESALAELNISPSNAMAAATRWGVFLHDALFFEPPLNLIAMNALEAGLILPHRLKGVYEIGAFLDQTLGVDLPWWQVDKEREGVILLARYVRPQLVYADQTQTDLNWPKTPEALLPLEATIEKGGEE